MLYNFYDDAGKLTGERGQNGLGYNYENLWDYDAVGNRTQTTARRNDMAGATQMWAHTTVVTSSFNANDQLTSQTSVVDNASTVTQSYGYDANGAEKTVASKSGNTNTGSSVNGWDFEGRLRTTQAKDAEGADNGGSSNAFDAMGDRLWHVADVGKPSQKTTSYVVDTDTSYAQVVEETSHDVNDGAGAARLQARYVWGQGLAPLAMWRRGSDGAFKLFYFVSDGQESVRQLTSTSGEVTDSYFYDAWGKGLAGGSGSTANPFRYTGQQLDSDGRYYLRARFYDPGNGRFLSHDPLMGNDSDPVSMHRYLYASADGANFCDPSGKNATSATETGTVNSIVQVNVSQVTPAATNVVQSVSAGAAYASPAANAVAGGGLTNFYLAFHVGAGSAIAKAMVAAAGVLAVSAVVNFRTELVLLMQSSTFKNGGNLDENYRDEYVLGKGFSGDRDFGGDANGKDENGNLVFNPKIMVRTKEEALNLVRTAFPNAIYLGETSRITEDGKWEYPQIPPGVVKWYRVEPYEDHAVPRNNMWHVKYQIGKTHRGHIFFNEAS